MADNREDQVPLLPTADGTQLPPRRRLHQILRDRRKVILVSLGLFLVAILIAGGVYLSRAHGMKKEGLVKGKHGAVATELDRCSELGVGILKKGGNALDAGIASALCIGTINSFSSGIGGGGFLIYRPADVSIPPKVINFRETAPAAASKNMYHGDEKLAQRGGLSVSVPGEIRGYEVAHQMFGKLPWADLFEPNIQIAREGIACPEELAARLQVYGQSFPQDPDWQPIFAPEGRLLAPGDLLKRSTFADTLEIIAKNGSQVFYEGDIARSLVNHAQKHGGTLTMDDMRNYQARVEDPLMSTYRDDLQILTCGSPSSGPVLIEGLNILENFNMSAVGNGPLGHHYLVEAMKYLSAGRTELGDPYYLKTEEVARMGQLAEKEYASLCAANISDTQTYDWDKYNPKYEFGMNHGTTSLSVVDSEGNAVAITTTVNLIFGSGLLDPRTGIILNDVCTLSLGTILFADRYRSKMISGKRFDLHIHSLLTYYLSIPGTSNAFGLRPSILNYIKAGKRSMSSQTPTLVTQDDQIRLSLGGSGGSRIVTAILDALVKRFDWEYDLSDTIRQPRVHHQLLPNIISAESSLDPKVIAGLKERGHEIELYPMGSPRSEIQAVEKLEGILYAMSDPRKRGQAAGY